MVIPSIPWWLAFAIGVPLGIVGYLGRAYVVGRRARRSSTAPAAGWGPSTEGRAAAEPVSPTPSAAQETPAGGEAVPAAPGVASEVSIEDVVLVTPSRGQQPRYGSNAASPGMVVGHHAETPAQSAPGDELVPVTATEVAKRRSLTTRHTQLRKRETYLENALDLIVAFVDGEPRRVRARACAKGLDQVLPKARRTAELKAFFQDVESGRSVADLQDDAEQVGVQLAVELKAVKTELLNEVP